MKLLVLPILAGAALTGIFGHGPNADLDAYAAKLQGAKSLTVTFRLANDGPPEVAKLEYSSPNKLKIDTVDTLTISDGTTLTVYNKHDNTYTVDGASTKPGLADAVYAWRGFFTNKPFADVTEVLPGSVKTIGGVSVNTYKLTLTGDRTATIFLDPARGVSMGAQVAKGSHIVQAIASSVIVGDTPLAVSEFTFTAPDGAKKIDKPVPAAASYASAQAVLNKYCTGCHDAQSHKGGLDLSSYDAIMAGGRGGSKVVIAGDPGSSKLIRMISGSSPQMPPNGADPVDAAGIKTLTDWIASGANNP